MAGNFLHFIKRLTLGLLLTCSGSVALFAQVDTVINNYAKVLTRSDYQVTVDDATGFSAGDYALIIQMKGASIDPANSSNHGNLVDIVGTPGQYEFIIIDNVDLAFNTITFPSIIKPYNTSGYVQIIRVPFFNSARFSKILTCEKWDAGTGTGGVLAFIVGGNLTLVQDIDVSGKGFAGGAADVGTGICASVAGISNVYSFDATFDNAGFKGEGIASHYFSGANLLLPYPQKGKGNLLTGGGGGNGRFSGGGGGSNRGGGFIGGLEDDRQCEPIYGGSGGYGITTYPSLDDPISRTGGIFMGGGGGSSTYSDQVGVMASAGGDGGGIVFIIADSVNGNNKSILASGNSALNATGISSGAGGGGAGGSIVIFSENYSSGILNIQANGAKGGDVFHSFQSNPIEGGGEGGGGGGGYVALLKESPLPSNININYTGGPESFVIDIDDPASVDGKGNIGDDGLMRAGVDPVLTGFLFNSIRSSVTGNQIDSVCSGMIPPKILGTSPMGGSGPYAYLWEKSYDQVVWTTLSNDADPVNYTPAVTESATVWFRRTVTSGAVTDVSKPVQFNVQEAIQNNTIVTTPDVLCFNGEPQPIMQGTPDLTPPVSYFQYSWEKSTDEVVWTNLNVTAKEFDPAGGLTETTWYRRTVIYGRCIDNSGVAKITVLPVIANNTILSPNQDICYGTSFADLTATTTATTPVLSGGDGIYRFKWESNTNDGGWVTAPGISDVSGYNPVELPQRIPSNQYIYRRVVYSGTNDVCSSVSNTVTLKDYPVITGNSISPVPTICSGSVPALIVGSKTPALAGGNGIYTYAWEQSGTVTNWTVIAGAAGEDYQPAALTSITRFRRIVNSTCTSTSGEITVNVDPPVLTNSISVLSGGVAQEICNNQVPVALQGTTATGGTGSFAYNWQISTDNIVFNPVPTGGTGLNYSPPALTSGTYYYKREVTSGACISPSNLVTVTVFPDITNNTITGDPSVCSGQVLPEISGSVPAGGSGNYNFLWEQSTNGGVNWTQAILTNNTQNYQAPALDIPTQYRRYVTSGANACCKSTSNILDIAIDPLPGEPDPGPDTSIFSINKLYQMKAKAPLADETGIWSQISGDGDIDKEDLYNTTVYNLSRGKSVFSWTVTKGSCKLDTTVSVTLLEDFIPEGFSPNGDTWNNEFIIEGLDPDNNYVDLSIVNGAGTEVFVTSNRPGSTWSDWDGKNSSGLDLPEGTYYYLLKVTPNSSEHGESSNTTKKQGLIVLKRY